MTTNFFMKRKILFLICAFFIVGSSYAQSNKEISLIDSLSKKWKIDSVEIKENKMSFPAPDNIKDNFLYLKKDRTFTGQDEGMPVSGKWKLNINSREIVNYEMNDPSLNKEVVFTIIKLTGEKLAITSTAASAGQVVIHYVATKE